MCGIAGLYAREDLGTSGRSLIRRMTDVIVHRGPDSDGFLLDGPVALGMRRLSIIDLEGGRQPVSNEDGSVSVVFNGEIYNYRELRQALLAAGHTFSTASDTEVLVHLYEEYGEECPRHLRGMFAFAIWDHPRRTLFIARDRLGMKPLYFAETARGFLFGSELKVLTCSSWVSDHVDPRALSAYLQYGYVPDPLAILEGVQKLPPAHAVTVRHGCAGKPRRYWEPTTSFQNSSAGSSEDAAGEALWSHLTDAVRSHLVSDVPVGAFLSGGVDSSAVLAVMAREAGAPVKTFSVGFSENGYNELPYARRVAEWFETEHHEIVLMPSDLGVLDEIMAAFDEPFADASAIPTYVVSRLARQHVKVVLSGDGGDELFAGYDRYLVDQKRRYLGLLGELGLGGSLRAISNFLPEGTPGKNYLYNLSLPRLERYLDSISLFPSRAVRELLDPAAIREPDPLYEMACRSGEGLDPLSRLQHLDLQTYLPGDILTKVDRMSMANSLETRVPLLDHPLVEFACGLPVRFRLLSGETKFLLKRILRGRVPGEVLTRPKQGFGVPLESWFSTRLPGFFRDRLENAGGLENLGIRPASLRRLMGQFSEWRRAEHCRRLWALVVLDCSLRKLSEVPAP